MPRSHQDLTNILIGGAEGHLGHAAVAFFARSGKNVIASCRTHADGEALTDFTRRERLTGVTVLTADLADESAVSRMIVEAERQVGPIQAVFNAAGGFRYGGVTECTVQDFDFLLNANLKSAWLLAKHTVPGMRARGFGRLVFVSARASLGLSEANMGPYTAAKAALNAIVESLAAELSHTGITVNAILPTIIDTPANRQAMPKADPEDWVATEALLKVVAELFGPMGDPINGALLPIAGRL